jgi:hypothetical protein
MASGDLSVFVTYFRGQEIRFAALTLLLLFTFHAHFLDPQLSIRFSFSVYRFGYLIVPPIFSLRYIVLGGFRGRHNC